MDADPPSKPGRKPKVTDAELLNAIQTILDETKSPIVTSTDLADAVDLKPAMARRRLKQLVEADVLASRKVGARARVWWPVKNEADAQDECVST